ncbi:MAG: hypothetical protein ACTSYH_07605 [Candidatus Heimdallarchaeaceae archaeon]
MSFYENIGSVTNVSGVNTKNSSEVLPILESKLNIHYVRYQEANK